jgi:hypothetical protein
MSDDNAMIRVESESVQRGLAEIEGAIAGLRKDFEKLAQQGQTNWMVSKSGLSLDVQALLERTGSRPFGDGCGNPVGICAFLAQLVEYLRTVCGIRNSQG